MRVPYSPEPRFRAVESEPTLGHSLQIKAKQKSRNTSYAKVPHFLDTMHYSGIQLQLPLGTLSLSRDISEIPNKQGLSPEPLFMRVVITNSQDTNAGKSDARHQRSIHSYSLGWMSDFLTRLYISRQFRHLLFECFLIFTLILIFIQYNISRAID